MTFLVEAYFKALTLTQLPATRVASGPQLDLRTQADCVNIRTGQKKHVLLKFPCLLHRTDTDVDALRSYPHGHSSPPLARP